jgi:hypothetical protein
MRRPAPRRTFCINSTPQYNAATLGRYDWV